MVDQREIARMRAFLRSRDAGSEDDSRSERWMKEAEAGNEEAFARVRQLASERGYEPLLGIDAPPPPGPLMVCPKDPAHYRTFVREVGEELICPEHEVQLIPLAQSE